MSVTDSIADMLTRVRNAVMAGHDSVTVTSSRAKVDIARILEEEGFIASYEIEEGKPCDQLIISLRYDEKRNSFIKGLERISKPGCRVYVKHDEIPRIYSGLGVAILSTSKGIVSGRHAWRQGLGGELVCYVW